MSSINRYAKRRDGYGGRSLETRMRLSVGFARALLADPDWPKKARLDREDKIVRCIYGNVCKNLDENFKRVRCGSLWPGEYLHAPEAPGGEEPPAWPEGGAGLAAKLSEGDARATLEKVSPQNRLVTSEEVAHVALMLVGENARGITGQAINVDGGTVMF